MEERKISNLHQNPNISGRIGFQGFEITNKSDWLLRNGSSPLVEIQGRQIWLAVDFVAIDDESIIGGITGIGFRVQPFFMAIEVGSGSSLKELVIKHPLFIYGLNLTIFMADGFAKIDSLSSLIPIIGPWSTECIRSLFKRLVIQRRWEKLVVPTSKEGCRQH